jgi:hypothetical protein
VHAAGASTVRHSDSGLSSTVVSTIENVVDALAQPTGELVRVFGKGRADEISIYRFAEK